MDDQDIEKLLRRYTPVGPSPELRARIVRRVQVVRLWPWAAAASLLLVATVALNMSTARTTADLDVRTGPDAFQLAVDDLTDLLGGDYAARRYAEAAVARDDAAFTPAAAEGTGELP